MTQKDKILLLSAYIAVLIWGTVTAVVLLLNLPDDYIILKNTAYGNNALVYLSCAFSLRIFDIFNLISDLGKIELKLIFLALQIVIYSLLFAIAIMMRAVWRRLKINGIGEVIWGYLDQ